MTTKPNKGPNRRAALPPEDVQMPVVARAAPDSCPGCARRPHPLCAACGRPAASATAADAAGRCVVT